MEHVRGKCIACLIECHDTSTARSSCRRVDEILMLLGPQICAPLVFVQLFPRFEFLSNGRIGAVVLRFI